MSGALLRGVRFPPVTGQGWGWVEGGDVLEQSLRALLLTVPGERIARPDYGAGLRRFLFAPASVETRARIAKAIEDAVARDEPRVSLVAVDIEPDPARPTLLFVTLRWRPKDGIDERLLAFPMRLDPEASA